MTRSIRLTAAAEALYSHHLPGPAPRHPEPGTDADRITGAGLALVAVMGIAPDGLDVDNVDIEPLSGLVTIHVTGLGHARQVATRLGLTPARLVAEIDDGIYCHRWHGEWADWPITVLCLYPAAVDIDQDAADAEAVPA